MTKKQILVSSLALFSTSISFAAGVNEYKSGAQISFTALATTSGGVFEGMPDAHTAAYYADNTNVTHMIIEGMQAPEGTSGIIGGDFILVDAATGETHGEGVIVYETNIGSGSSAIVGVIPLAGGLANASITRQTPESPLGGKTASLTYSPTAGAMKFDTGSGESVINYLCAYEGELEMEAPFWIDTAEGGMKFSEGFVEVLENDSMGGVLMTDVMGDTVAESIFLVTVSDVNDSDSDGVADLLDADNYWYSGSNYDSESGWLSSPWFGQFGFVYSPRNNDAWNGFVAENHCFFWHEQHGYLYGEALVSDSTRWAIFYDYNLGWLATNEASYPYIYAYDAMINGASKGATWLYFVPQSGYTAERVFYAFDGDMRQGSSYGSGNELKGWWGVSGAYSN